MRKLFSIFLIFFVSLSMFQEIHAKRFGGGRSFGVQRSVSSYSRPPHTSPQAAPASRPSTGNKWLGPLAGIAAGGLLASLMMGHGLGSGLLSWLAVAGIGLLLWNLFKNKFQSQTQPQFRQHNQNRDNNLYNASSQFSPSTENVHNLYSQSLEYPAGFDADAFIRDAKVYFIRLQAAYDTKNISDLREFTAPEVFAEIQMQLQERGEDSNQTDVVNLEAELLNAEKEMNSLFATVQFSGLIKENIHEPAASFKEVWHFRKNYDQNNWMVAGVQQLVH